MVREGKARKECEERGLFLERYFRWISWMSKKTKEKKKLNHILAKGYGVINISKNLYIVQKKKNELNFRKKKKKGYLQRETKILLKRA